ncbi:hypothetical protein JCM10207_001336 [Rhodosporidiobolus poonsookiae]
MTQHHLILDTLLVLYPLSDALLEGLRNIFPVVLYRPCQGPVPKGAQRPTKEDYAVADAIFAFTLPEDVVSVEQTPRLKLFQGCSSGYSHLDDTSFIRSASEKRRDVTFANASGIHVSTISEHIIATVLMLYHKLHILTLHQHREQSWLPTSALGSNFIRELNTLTVGIIGYGHIGREAARLFTAHGSTVYALNRSGQPSAESGFVIPHTGDPAGTLPARYFATSSRPSTMAFFSACDVVVNTLPDSVATRGFVGEEELRAMKGDAVYVNIGRGTTTDQEKLVEALRAVKSPKEDEDATGTLRIGGASLDVTTPEPLPQHHPLYTLPNVILTPHMSGASRLYFTRALEVLKVNTERMRRGQGALNGWFGRGEGYRG